MSLESSPSAITSSHTSNEVVDLAGHTLDPSMQNSLNVAESTNDIFSTNVEPDTKSEASEVSQDTLAYKAGYFIGKHFGKKIVQDSFDEPDFAKQVDLASEGTEKLGATKLSSVEKSFLEVMGYSQDDPEGLAMLSNYKKPDKTSEELENIFSIVSKPDVVAAEEIVETVTDQVKLKSAEELVTPAEAAVSLERDRVVKDAPWLVDIAKDTTRTNIIRYTEGYTASMGADRRESDILLQETEQSSVAELVDFFESVIALGQSSVDSVRAQDMLENLTFIGGKERAEAAKGIAQYWKQQLIDNPQAQICVVTEISSAQSTKSDKFLFDSILAEFSDEEIASMEGRLVTNLADLTADPKDTRIILLDDWVISGSQAKDAYSKLSSKEGFSKYIDCVELQLVTSTQDRINSGLIIWGNGLRPDKSIPIRSYFRSHSAKQETQFTSERHKSYETGAHSSVDYDFELTYIANMLSLLNENRPASEPRRRMPATTRIIREYRSGKLGNIGRLERTRRERKLREGNNSEDADNLQSARQKSTGTKIENPEQVNL